MKVPLLLLSLALAGCATTTIDTPGAATKAMPAGQVTSTLPSELGTSHPALLRAWQTKDAPAMRPYYTEDVVVDTRTARFAGWHEVVDRWITPTLQNMTGFMAMPTSFTRSGEEILEQGRYSFQMLQDGQTVDVSGVYAQRWQRQQSGLWRVKSASLISEPN